MPISNYLANKTLDGIFKATAWITPVTGYVALFLTHVNAYDNVTDLTEVTGTGYTRVQIQGTSTAAAKKTITNDGVLATTFAAPTAAWGTVMAVGICDQGSSGNNLLWYENICPRTIANGDPPPSFPIKGIRLTFDIEGDGC